MGKKRVFIDLETGEEFTVDEDECVTLTYNDFAKSGYWGKQEQYKYFCEHPEEIVDEKLFKRLEKEFMKNRVNNGKEKDIY